MHRRWSVPEAGAVADASNDAHVNPDGLTLLVCGGRDYPNRANVFRVLDHIHARQPIGLIVTGACPDGADRWAEEWAKEREIPYLGVPARWKTEGRSAGPKRNSRMPAMVQLDGVLGFPSKGTGTADMLAKAHAAGIRTRTADDDGNLRDWSP